METNTGKVREFCQSGKVGTMSISFDFWTNIVSFTNTQNWVLEAFLCETHCRNINKFCLLRGDQKILRMALILTDSPAATCTVRNL